MRKELLEKIGFMLIGISFGLCIFGIAYFGTDHYFPQSKAEWICAVIAISMCISGLILLSIYGKKHNWYDDVHVMD